MWWIHLAYIDYRPVYKDQPEVELYSCIIHVAYKVQDKTGSGL